MMGKELMNNSKKISSQQEQGTICNKSILDQILDDFTNSLSKNYLNSSQSSFGLCPLHGSYL
jgi:hypothetical protein